MTKDTTAAAATTGPIADPLAAARDAGQALQRAHDELIAKRLELLGKIKALEEEAQGVRTSPLRADEFKELLFKHIDRLAGTYPSQAGWRELLTVYANPTKEGRPISLDDMSRIEAGGGFTGRLEEQQHLLSGVKALPLSNAALVYFFFGEQIKRRITQYLPHYLGGHGMALPEDGPTVDEKRARIAALEELLSPLRAELDEVNRNYDELGLLARKTVASA